MDTIFPEQAVRVVKAPLMDVSCVRILPHVCNVKMATMKMQDHVHPVRIPSLDASRVLILLPVLPAEVAIIKPEALVPCVRIV